MLYDIWAVRSDGDERSLVVCRPKAWGPPEGFSVRYLGSEAVPDQESALFLFARAVAERDVIQRELARTYPDPHPLRRGSIARECFECFGPPRLDAPRSWLYWVNRIRDAIVSEMQHRQYSTARAMREGPEILRELWRL